VTQSAGDTQDLKSDQNSKPREAVKRQRVDPVDPTKPNMTQSAGDSQDLKSDQNSKPREAVKRQRVEPVDPTKPNVTQSAGDRQDLRSDQNSKPIEAVKRQRAEPVDPLTESKLKLTKTTPTVTGLDAPTNEVASVAGKKGDLRPYIDFLKRMRANDHAAVPEVRTTSKFKQDEAVPSPSHSRQKTTSGSPSLQGWMRKDNRQSRSTRFNTSNQLL
jgi:hypothetical protein